MKVQESWRMSRPINSITNVVPSVEIFTHTTSYGRSSTTRSCPRHWRTFPCISLVSEPLLAHILCHNRDLHRRTRQPFPERRTPALVRCFLELTMPSTAVQCNTTRLRSPHEFPAPLVTQCRQGYLLAFRLLRPSPLYLRPLCQPN